MIVELPKDADGREIPLDTALLYGEVSGDEYEVVCFNFSPSMRRWMTELKRRDDLGIYATENFTLSPPDSWEKLEDDLRRGADAVDYEACAYFGKSACGCSSCIADKGKTCESVVMRDIASRIRKLRGSDE